MCNVTKSDYRVELYKNASFRTNYQLEYFTQFDEEITKFFPKL